MLQINGIDVLTEDNYANEAGTDLMLMVGDGTAKYWWSDWKEIEELARTLEAECEACDGRGELDTSGFGDINNCEDCNTTGKRSILDVWTDKYK